MLGNFSWRDRGSRLQASESKTALQGSSCPKGLSHQLAQSEVLGSSDCSFPPVLTVLSHRCNRRDAVEVARGYYAVGRSIKPKMNRGQQRDTTTQLGDPEHGSDGEGARWLSFANPKQFP